MKIYEHDQFSRCKECTSLTQIVRKGTVKQRAEAKALRDLHWARVTQERRWVEAAKYKSLHESEDFFFCEIDGMDSAKTLLPHFSQFDKTIKKDKLLKLHLTCVKYNGTRPDDLYYFTDAFPHDSANTITVMYKTLLKVNRPVSELGILNTPTLFLLLLKDFARSKSCHVADATCRTYSEEFIAVAGSGKER